MVDIVDKTLERVKQIEDLTKFSKSMVTRPPKPVVAEPNWLSATMGRGLGDMLGNLAVPQPSSCRECVMLTRAFEEQDKAIKELGAMLELLAAQARGPGDQVDALKE